MDSRQLAAAVVNDRGTEGARALALARFSSEGTRCPKAIFTLVPVVAAELRKPIYEGFEPYPGMLWEAAALVLDFEIGLAIDLGRPD